MAGSWRRLPVPAAPVTPTMSEVACAWLLTASYEVDQRVKNQPHHVDETPVQPNYRDRGRVFPREFTAPCPPDNPTNEPESDQHVKSVERGSDEVENKEHLRAGTGRP